MTTRSQIADALRGALMADRRPLATVLAGSDAFGRADALSDLDLSVVCEAGHTDGVFALVGQVLELLFDDTVAALVAEGRPPEDSLA